MQLSKADYYEFLVHVHRLQLSQQRALEAANKAESDRRKLEECKARMVATYPDFPVSAHGWRWDDRTFEIKAEE